MILRDYSKAHMEGSAQQLVSVTLRASLPVPGVWSVENWSVPCLLVCPRAAGIGALVVLLPAPKNIQDHYYFRLCILSTVLQANCLTSFAFFYVCFQPLKLYWEEEMWPATFDPCHQSINPTQYTKEGQHLEVHVELIYNKAFIL